MTVLAILLAVAASSAEPYFWPLELPPELTSSFGEYRTGRIHAGIDLRTGGIGLPVYAAGDGYVSRVRCSPFGYGKAVYLRLRDGNTVVYGHLDDYYPELRDYVRRAQHEKKSYTVDLEPAAEQFRVSRGQLVAKSGQTGIGAPHLHYELRDNREWLINPRKLGITWPDKTRPIIYRVLVAPEGPGSTVNGDLIPVLLDVRSNGTGRYVTDPVRVSGRFGLAVSYTDPAGDGAYKLGAYRLVAHLGQTEAFRVQCDTFSYDHWNDGIVIYHPFFNEGAPFQLLWRWTGNACETYQASQGTGWMDAPASTTEAAIEIADFHENNAVVTIPVAPDRPAAPKQAAAAGSGKGEASMDVNGEFMTVSVKFSAPEGVRPEALVESDNDVSALSFLAVNDRLFRAAFRPERTGRYELRVTHPRLKSTFSKTVAAFVRGQAATVPLGDVKVSADANSPYGVLFCAVEPVKQEACPAGGELKWVGPAYRFWPRESPIGAALHVSFPTTSLPEKGGYAVYRTSGKSWSRVGGEFGNAAARFSTENLGTFAVLADATAPAISDVRPSAGAAVKSPRPEISSSISDKGSGVASYEVTCGNKWLLTAYDPEHGRISWERDEDLPAGAQEIVIEVKDEAGNTARVTRKITVPGPAQAQKAGD